MQDQSIRVGPNEQKYPAPQKHHTHRKVGEFLLIHDMTYNSHVIHLTHKNSGGSIFGVIAYTLCNKAPAIT